jgi:polysaccharide export outer membrane protein
MKLSAILPLLLVILLSGCMHNKIRYIHDKNEVFENIEEYENKAPDYQIQASDILYIKISSTNKEINEYFEIGSSQLNNQMGGGQGNNFYLRGFCVSDSGYVSIPVLGDIYVEGFTIKEVQELVQKKTDNILNNAIITVKLVSFYITFLGEVNSQGKITVMQDEINILDAISLAGGIADYGNKKNVLVVRQTQKGTKTFRVDLTERELLTSEKFYMLPNDIVIVEPLKSKSFQLGVRDYSLLLTTVTSTITMVLLVINLLK